MTKKKRRNKSRGARAAAVEPRHLFGGARALWAVVPALIMVALTFVPSVAARGPVRVHVWAAAGASALVALWLARRGPLEVGTAVRRPHYMQAITQTGVFVYWGMHWAPVAGFAWLIALQVAFAYQVDALISWARGKRWSLGFGQLPIVFSINLFLWFEDAYFGWQLVMVALCYLGKELIVWERDGRRRHIFNPSSFGLAVVSIALLVTGTSDVTLGRQIALTQEDTPYFIHVLFALGLIVQIQFSVVLVTAVAAVTTWLLGVVFLRVTGVYMFATTDIPAAVFLGMLLLVTDPATSPNGRAAKVLFGASYGALVFLLFPLLEAKGSLGYYDKLLPVPFLNLLVRRFEGWGRAIGARVASSDVARPPSTMRNLAHVGIWALVFAFLVGTDAVGRAHPGRDITFWQRACSDKRFHACTTYFNLLTNDCDAGHAEACHNLGAELMERELAGEAVPEHGAAKYLRRACELGIEPSCVLLASPPGGAEPTVVRDPLQALASACDEGSATACHQLAHTYEQGAPQLPRDPAKARAYYQRGCDLGSVQSCSSLAALAMQAGGAADTEMAKRAFAKACEGGDAPGCANLAGMYALGQGVERDLARAATLNDKACTLRLGVACARLADAYANGLGVERDAARARTLNAQACALGFRAACPAP